MLSILVLSVLLYTAMAVVVLYLVWLYTVYTAFVLLLAYMYTPFVVSLFLVYQKERYAPNDKTSKNRVLCALALNITTTLFMYLPVLYFRVYHSDRWEEFYLFLFIIFQIAVLVNLIVSVTVLLIELFILDALDGYLNTYIEDDTKTLYDYGTLTV